MMDISYWAAEMKPADCKLSYNVTLSIALK